MIVTLNLIIAAGLLAVLYGYVVGKQILSASPGNSKMQEIDYLLILHTEKSTAKEVITGKFYEYLKSKTPIIVISEGQTECGNLVKNLGVGYDVDYSKISLSNFFLELGKYPNLNKKINLKIFSRDFQNEKLVNLIK